MTNEFSVPPEGTKLRKHSGAEFYFGYPDGGLFVDFTHPDGTTVTRLIVDDAQTRYRVELEHLAVTTSAQALAHELFEASRPQPENVPPVEIALSNAIAWRQRRLFIDGARAALLIDTAFIQNGPHVYRLQFATAPAEHAQGLWIFDTVLRTLHFNDLPAVG